MMDEAGGEERGGAETDAEAFYVAARVLEEVAKSEGDTEGAAVCARVAGHVRNGDDADKALETVAEDADDRTTERLRVALREVRESGGAKVVERVDDAVVARLRSGFDG